MRFLIATPLFPPDIGGPATDAHAVALQLRHDGHTVEVVTFSSVRHLPRGIRHIKYLINLFRIGSSLDVIIAFDTVSVGIPALIVSCMRRIPLVLRVPGDYAWEQGKQRFGVQDDFDVFQTRKYGVAVETFRFLQKSVVSGAALVVTPSLYMMRVVAGWGVAPERLKYVYLGLPFPEKEGGAQAREEKRLFTYGRHVPWKGFSMVLEVLADLNTQWTLAVGGDGPMREELERYARALGLQDRVTFLGQLSEGEVRMQLRQATALVYNTQWESFSFQILEAMQEGVAIITTRVGSLPELVEDGRDGVLLTPDDKEAFVKAIKSLMTESQTWETRRYCAREAAKRFTLEASSSSFVRHIYDLCISSS